MDWQLETKERKVTMKKTIVFLAVLFLAGCQNNSIKPYLADALIAGEEVRQVELAKGNTDTAGKIQVWLDAGKKIYDTDSYTDNCGLMISVSEIAYDWVIQNYPEKVEYRIPIALLKSKLMMYCEVKP